MAVTRRGYSPVCCTDSLTYKLVQCIDATWKVDRRLMDVPGIPRDIKVKFCPFCGNDLLMVEVVPPEILALFQEAMKEVEPGNSVRAQDIIDFVITKTGEDLASVRVWVYSLGRRFEQPFTGSVPGCEVVEIFFMRKRRDGGNEQTSTKA